MILFVILDIVQNTMWSFMGAALRLRGSLEAMNVSKLTSLTLLEDAMVLMSKRDSRTKRGKVLYHLHML